MDITPSSHLTINISLSQPISQPYISPSPRPSKMEKKKTIYFGYGSNLWLHQMRQRCPTSKYLGIARLKGYKWIIYERGYANIVELSASEKATEERDKPDYSKEVWGLIYTLEPEDERRLDGNEGVPYAYQKEEIECEFWTASSARTVTEDTEDGFSFAAEGKPDISKKPGKEKMLVYINRHRTSEGVSKEEYVYRMNCGIKDAVKEGVPKEYIEQVLRKWIPEDDEEVGEREREVALRQAERFVDEREG